MDSTGMRSDRVLLLLLALGLALRLGVGFATLPDRVLLGDEATYVRLSEDSARSGELTTGFFVRPPLYFALLTAPVLLSVPVLPAIVLLQCLASAATGIVVYRATLRMASRRAARFAAGFLLLDPVLIAYSHLLWPETLYLLGASLVFDGAGRLTPESWRRNAAVGALTGACMLLKPVFGLFTPILAVFWWRRFGAGGALRLAAVFALATALVIAPWIVRNQLRYGGSILLENQAGYNLWIGNDPRPLDQVAREYVSIPGEAERSRIGLERGFALIAADPSGFARSFLRRVVNLWGLEYFALRHLAFGGYGPTPDAVLLAAFWLIQLAYAFTRLVAALGFGVWPKGSVLHPVLGFAALFTLVVSAMVATTRFAVPFAFLFAISAGLAAASPGRAVRQPRGWIALAVVLLLLGVSATRPVFAPFLRGELAAEDLRRPDWFFFRY